MQDRTRNHPTIPTLDGFRALAICIVMASHYGLEHVVPGQFGVTLFFFLSGFLITTLLRQEIERSGRIRFSAFYLRRAVRIMPPMYLTITVMVALSAFGLIRQINFPGLVYDFAFLTNYFPVSGVPIGLWSLAVEEHFYLGFPILLAALSQRMSLQRCAAVCLALCGAVLLIRLWEVERLADYGRVNFWTHTRLDSILFGSVLALWNNPVIDEKGRTPNWLVGYAVAALFLVPSFVIRDEVFRQTFRYSLQGLGLMALFHTAIRDRRFAWPLLDNPPLRWIAALSYTLYLVHSGMTDLFTPVGDDPSLLGAAAALACSFGFAMLMRRYIELPLGAWRRSVERATAPAQTAGPDGGPEATG